MTAKTRYARTAMAIGALAMLAVSATPAVAFAGAKTELVSKSNGGVKGNQASSEPSISKTGRYVAFNSAASNLVPDDTNGSLDCFVRDINTKTVERVSVASGGSQTNGRCFGPAISPDGRYVAFESNATNLDGPSNGWPQIYLHDRVANTTTLVSRRDGAPGNAGSADPAVSNGGKFVVYESDASNLVGIDTNNKKDVFVWDLATGTTKKVSVRSNGVQGNNGSRDPAISAWGTYIVFDSLASNLVSNDKNGVRDVFMHNRVTGKTQIVSVNSAERRGNGPSGNASVSADGRWVAFESKASNMTTADRTKGLDVFVRDRKKGKTIQISLSSRGKQGTGWSGDPTISFTGRYIAFESAAPDLVSKDPNKKWDVFLRDRVKRTTKILSRRANGQPAWGGNSDDPFISGDGRFVAFESQARKIVIKDQDSTEDIYRRGPLR